MVLLVLLCSAIYKLTKFVMRAGPFRAITFFSILWRFVPQLQDSDDQTLKFGHLLIKFEHKGHYWLAGQANKQCDQIEDGARNVEGDEQKDHSKIKQVWNVACDVKKLWGFVKNTTAYQLG